MSEMGEMGGRLGYEYRYKFRMEDDKISVYQCLGSPGVKSFLFELGTKFTIITKRRPATEDEEGTIGGKRMIGSETFSALVEENEVEPFLTNKLKKYRMTDDEIGTLVNSAMDFARKTAADPQHASLRVLPLVVELEVCTVRQEGEMLIAFIGRAIMGKHFVPPYPPSAGHMDYNPHEIIKNIGPMLFGGIPVTIPYSKDGAKLMLQEIPKNIDTTLFGGMRVIDHVDPLATLMDYLPQEITKNIFDRVSDEDKGRCLVVCINWCGILYDDLKYIIEYRMDPRVFLRYKAKIHEERAIALWLSQKMGEGETLWAAYLRIKETEGIKESSAMYDKILDLVDSRKSSKFNEWTKEYIQKLSGGVYSSPLVEDPLF